MTSGNKLDSVYDLLRRVPPKKIETRLFDAISLAPDEEDTLLSTVDIPLKIKTDEVTSAEYVACEFNRDLDSHRSPFSNQYFPPIEDGQRIPERLRDIEIKANTAFGAYRNLYFKGGISSVYLWEIDENIFGMGIFIKNQIDTLLQNDQKIKGSIDCSDTVEITENGNSAKYTLTSSVLMHVELDLGFSKPIEISGNVSESKEKTISFKNDDDHIVNVGKMVEENSAHFRDLIEELYVSKIKYLIDLLRNNEVSSNQKLLADGMQNKIGGN